MQARRECDIALLWTRNLNEPMRSVQNPRNVDASAGQGCVSIKPLPRNQDQIMKTQNAPHQPQQIEVRIDVDA
jgi:hypothetical protein